MERARKHKHKHKNKSQRESKHEAKQEVAGCFEDEQDLEVPDAYECPITTELMQDPVVVADGRSYERTAIEEWFRKGHSTSPMTNEKLPHRTLIPNINLRNLIQDFIAKRPILQREKMTQDDLRVAIRLREEELQARLEKEEKRRIAEEKQKGALTTALMQEQARAVTLEERLAQQNTPSSQPLGSSSSSSLSFFPSSRVEEKKHLPLPNHPPKDEKPSLEVLQLRQRAEQGDAEAQYQLGWRLENGLGVTHDMKAATVWYEKAAKQQEVAAQASLGRCYFYGDGVEKNGAKALDWLHQAARESNHPAGQYALGFSYWKGLNASKDDEQAFAWFKKAAKQKFADAQYALGLCYANSQGIVKDEQEAVAWYRRAAEQNQVNAQYNLGVCYLDGVGVAKDEKEAVTWFRKAAAQDEADAQFALGMCYENGRGIAADKSKAIDWYKRAAAQGHPGGKRAPLLAAEEIEQVFRGLRL
jgi:TPR repeat protein